MSATANEPSSTRTPPFERVLCLTGPTREGAEAVRQAAVVAGPGATVDLVTDEPAGVLDSVAGHDLVVVPQSETGLEVLAGAKTSVLVARPTTSTPFPESILVAVDGTAEAHAAARLGAELSVRHAAPVTLVATPEHDASHQRALQRHIEVVERLTGTRPLVLDEHCRAVPSILAAAAGMEASLIVLGRRPGAHDPSVSAQVAGAAKCSVLVVGAGRVPGSTGAP
jgi:hypothetical protein